MLKSLGVFFLDILEVIVMAVALFMFIYILIMQPHKIKGVSMHPNFPDGEFLLTDKVSYRFNEPKRGDVIVFKAPASVGNEDEFIKRIIGVPGDTVSISSNKVYINNSQLKESYLDPNLPTHPGNFLQEGKSVVVPVNEYFVLGDNRPHSSDSRAWGFVPKSAITGRAWVVYWPPESAGAVEKVNYNL